MSAEGRISSVRTRVVSYPYRRPFGISSGTSTELVSIFVEVTDTEGHVGFGEAAPMTAYTGETLEGVHSAIGHLGRALVGCPSAGIAAAHVIMDTALRGQRLAKAAVDIALHDLVARSVDVPLHALLGGQVRDHVPIAWVVGLGDADDVVAEAVQHVNKGFGTSR